MVATWATAQEARPVRVNYTTFDAVNSVPKRIGDECFVPISTVSPWGWQVRLDGPDADIQAEGRRIRVDTRVVDGQIMLPLVAAAYQLGADVQWSPDGSALRVLAVIRSAEIVGSTIRIDSTLSVSQESFVLQNPERLVVDFQGAKLWGGANSAIANGITMTQNGNDKVRLVIERTGVGEFLPKTRSTTRSFSLAIEKPKNLTPSYQPLERVETPQFGTAGTPQGPSTPLFTVEPIKVDGAVRVSRETENECWLLIPLSATLSTRPSGNYSDVTTIEVLLMGVRAPTSAPDLPDSKFLGSLQLHDDGRGNTRLVAVTKQALGFQLSLEGRIVKLKLIKPKAANGKLAGKTIVVDAGHGGDDGGATWKSPLVREKDLTLKIARQLARQLSAEGAAVVMTRNDDTRIPLNERPAIATRSRADAFISIHINSNKLNNSRSGSITFFHSQDPVARLFSECVQREIAKTSGIPNMGCWSDTRIYESGFAVLRNATVPAILIECGFINHSYDRGRMVTETYQVGVASSIIRGLKVFFGDGKVENRNN